MESKPTGGATRGRISVSEIRLCQHPNHHDHCLRFGIRPPPDNEVGHPTGHCAKSASQPAAAWGHSMSHVYDDHAKTWLPIDKINPHTTVQIQCLSALPFFFKRVAVMPDCHPSATVGTACIPTLGTIIATAVGADIGGGNDCRADQPRQNRPAPGPNSTPGTNRAERPASASQNTG